MFKKLFPLLALLGVLVVVWMIYCTLRSKSIVPLKGWSPFSTNPLPAAGIEDRSSNTMGMRTY